MRSPSTLSEASVNPSFFLTTPAKKPRTECCCQSVAFMIAAMVVPLGSRSIARTVACFDEAAVASFAAGFVTADFAAAAGAGFDRTGRCFFAGRFAEEAILRTDLAGFDFDFVVAIWLSIMSTTASRAATAPAPPIGRGGGKSEAGCYSRERRLS